MAKKISRVTKDSKLDKRTTSGRAASGKDTTNKSASNKIMKRK